MVAPHTGLVLLLSSTGSPALPGGPLRLVIPHQARVETPLLEFHPPGDPRQDLLFPADSQRLFKINVGKDEGPLGVHTLDENPRHSSASMAANRRPIAPEGMAYQLVDCAAS